MNQDEAHVFFADARIDPVLHYMTRQYLDAWTRGYLRACGDHEIGREDWDVVFERAIEEMHVEHAKALIAMAQIVQTLPKINADAIMETLGRKGDAPRV